VRENCHEVKIFYKILLWRHVFQTRERYYKTAGASLLEGAGIFLSSMKFRLAVRAHCESCLLYNEVLFPRSFCWGEKLTVHLHSVKLCASAMTQEILPNRHFFLVDPLIICLTP
jgi:hypothetical protein